MVAPRKKPVLVSAKPAGIYGDILKITGMKREGSETLVQYVERVGTHMGAMPDESFALFSTETQEWFDKTVEAVNAKKPDDIPPVSGWPEDAPAAVESKKEEAKPETAPAKEAAPAKAAAPAKKEPEVSTKKTSKKPILKKKAAAPAKKPIKKAAAKASNGAAKPKQRSLPGVAEGGKVRTDGVAYKIRMAVLKSPNISFEDACKKADAEAKSGGHAHNYYNHVTAILRMQKALAG